VENAMAYRFKHDFATVQDGLRKIAVELIDEATDATGSKARDFHKTVHTLRKTCKKLRGLIRLVRPVFDDYQTENAAFREAGREFSFLRDGGVMIETYDDLMDSYKDQVERGKFAPVRRKLTVLQNELESREGIDTILDEFQATMKEARKRAHRWHIATEGFDAIEPGVRRSYKGARHAMADASSDPTPQAIHEWRKRVKDHWYHARLLSPIWPRPMQVHCKVADQLGDALGRHHDLEVFSERLASEDLGGKTERDVLAGLVRRKQNMLEHEAFSIGARLLAEPAGSLTRRWRSYWDTWHEDRPGSAALAA
jgi:CHAD domain-containing protein